jgi:AraC-like DNA-binding protein
MVRYREVRPGAALARFVELYWLLSGEPSADDGDPDQPVFPDGRMEIVLNLADPFVEHRDGAAPTSQPLAMVVGQMDRPVRIAPTGRVDLLGIRLRPAGAASILGVPAGDLRGALLGVDAVSTALHRDLARIGEARTDAARISLVQAALGIRVAGAKAAPDAVVWAAESLVASPLPVDRLATRAGLGVRQLERQFDRWVGLPPKLFSRIQRFQRVLLALRAGPESAVHAALSCGYYDQAHLVRDFRAFTGEPPIALLASLHDFTLRFTRARDVAFFQDGRHGRPYLPDPGDQG